MRMGMHVGLGPGQREGSWTCGRTGAEWQRGLLTRKLQAENREKEPSGARFRLQFPTPVFSALTATVSPLIWLPRPNAQDLDLRFSQ